REHLRGQRRADDQGGARGPGHGRAAELSPARDPVRDVHALLHAAGERGRRQGGGEVRARHAVPALAEGGGSAAAPDQDLDERRARVAELTGSAPARTTEGALGERAPSFVWGVPV